MVWQDGEYILREGEALTSTSKFYLVQSGTVECFKQFSVGSWLRLMTCTSAPIAHLEKISP